MSSTSDLLIFISLIENSFVFIFLFFHWIMYFNKALVFGTIQSQPNITKQVLHSLFSTEQSHIILPNNCTPHTWHSPISAQNWEHHRKVCIACSPLYNHTSFCQTIAPHARSTTPSQHKIENSIGRMPNEAQITIWFLISCNFWVVWVGNNI